LITLITFGEAYKLWSSSLCSLLQSPATSSLLSKHSPQHPVLKHPQYSLKVRDQVSVPYKTTDKMTSSRF
jgi:hypothetical protein